MIIDERIEHVNYHRLKPVACGSNLTNWVLPQFNAYEGCLSDSPSSCRSNTSLIRTGRLTRPLPIIRSYTESPATSPFLPIILNPGNFGAVKQHSRVPKLGRKCVTNILTFDYKNVMEGALPPRLKPGVSAL